MYFKKIIRILALTPMVALALEPSPVSEIKVLQTYTNWGNADVVVVLQSTSGVCKGYWFNKDDTGYQSTSGCLSGQYKAVGAWSRRNSIKMGRDRDAFLQTV